MNRRETQKTLALPQFPRSAGYDAEWIVENQMGPCALWLCEFLMEKMELKPGMRVLDMGCGKGLTSVFLAKECGVTVFANDLWIQPTENYKRFQEAGLADKIIPIHAEARQLPYAAGFFDAIVSIDSYEYYGTDALYLDYISRFLKQEGQIGIVVPALQKEFGEGGAPAHILRHWDWSMASFHSPAWWARLWRLSKHIDVEASDLLPNGFDMWLHWEKAMSALKGGEGNESLALLEADKGEYFSFARIVGRKGLERW